VIWRPHGYAPLRKMLLSLAEMFNEVMRPCDSLLLLPVYDAGGTTDRSINSADLAALIKGNVKLTPDYEAVMEFVVQNKCKYSAFVTCGARDPGLPDLARHISNQFAEF